MIDCPSLLAFFEQYYLPVCLGDAQPRTIETYRSSLLHWQRATGDPALSAITAATLRQFVEHLKTATRAGTGVSPNTLRKHLRHIQAVLDRAGPPAARCRDAAGILETVPWVRPPRAELREPRPAGLTDLCQLYRSCDAARLPRLAEIRPAAWWHGLLALICCTSLRIGQTLELPATAVDFNGSRLIVPAAVSRKSRRDQTYPLPVWTLQRLLAIRGPRPRLFPWPHAKSALYDQLRRLQQSAGIPASRQFTFHGIRRAVLDDFASHSPTAAQQAAGHASFRTTMDHYLSSAALAAALERSPLLEQLAGF